MHVVVAPDSFKGTLTAVEAARAIAAGWRSRRPDDDLVLRPMSDGGDGLLDVLTSPGDEVVEVEVADPLGLPRQARFLLRGDQAMIESAEACGLSLVPPARRNPIHTTTYGVGQLLDAARASGARRVLVGVGGSATVDGGAGALAALGYRVATADGGGLKVGGGELVRVEQVEPRWLEDWDGVEVEVLADVRTPLLDAPRRFGPQKGAHPVDVERLTKGLQRWADVVEHDLRVALRDRPGTGAAGGLAFGLAAGLGAEIVAGASLVAELVGLPAELDRADLLVVGEGTLDGTSFDGKVVGALVDLAAARGVPVAAVVGRIAGEVQGLERIEETGPEPARTGDAALALEGAAAQLASRVG